MSLLPTARPPPRPRVGPEIMGGGQTGGLGQQPACVHTDALTRVRRGQLRTPEQGWEILRTPGCKSLRRRPWMVRSS